MATRQRLKRDNLGAIWREARPACSVVVRDTDAAHRGLKWLARCLARREAHALARLRAEDGFPALIEFDGRSLVRSYVEGDVMFVARPSARAYFKAALRIVRRMHRHGVAHNDLAKEANWLCRRDGSPAIVDFQLASVSARRGPVFRALAREDLRHLYKHKRFYLPGALTARQRQLLARPSLAAGAWRRFGKPVQRFVTRRLLGWPERAGAAERQS